MNHYVAMFFFMFLAGLLSTMNLWAIQWDDLRWSLNDLYMILVMTGWMFVFMGLHDRKISIIGIGVLMVVIGMALIRTQFGIHTNQYLQGMIPHHSMAVLMSRRLLEKNEGSNLSPEMTAFLERLTRTQEEEIVWMKRYPSDNTATFGQYCDPSDEALSFGQYCDPRIAQRLSFG
jgi:Domain of unknown function (DUF305)